MKSCPDTGLLWAVALAGGDPLAPFVVGDEGAEEDYDGEDGEEPFHGDFRIAWLGAKACRSGRRNYLQANGGKLQIKKGGGGGGGGTPGTDQSLA